MFRIKPGAALLQCISCAFLFAIPVLGKSDVPGDPLALTRQRLEREVAEMDAAQGQCDANLKTLDARRDALWNAIRKEVAGVAFDRDASWNRLNDRLDDLRNEAARGQREKEVATLAKPELSARYAELEALDTRREQVKQEAATLRRKRDGAWRSIQGLAPRKIAEKKDQRTAVLKVPPPEDAEARRARFAERNAPDNILALGQKLARYLDLDAPGLEQIKALLQEERYAEALDAYKVFFIAKMQSPRQYGLPETAFRNWLLVRQEPPQQWLEDAMQGVFRQEYRGEILKVDVGTPGAMQWCFVNDDYLGFNLENKLVSFYRGLGRPFTVNGYGVRTLFDGYLATGDARYLEAWCAVIDDWYLNWRDAVNRCPENIRSYDAIAADLNVFLGQLRVAACTQENFGEGLSSASLVRALMQAIEEYGSVTIRVKRSTIFNWTAMGLDQVFRFSLLLPEWRSMQWSLTEARKLAEREWRLTIAPDGGGREFSDEGHQGVWAWVYANILEMLGEAKPAWYTPEYEREFRDLTERNLRFFVRHLKPDGHRHNDDYRGCGDFFFSKTPWFDGPHSLELQAPELLEEPEIARVLNAVYGAHASQADVPEAILKAGPPTHLDDAMPYLATFYQRRSWDPKDHFLYMRALKTNSNPDEDCAGLKVWAFGRMLMEVPPIYVDGISQNVHHGLIENPGGKTEFLVYDDGMPGRGLWHASERFGLMEGIYEGAYEETGNRVHWSPFKSGGFAIPLQSVGKPAVTDVLQHSRRVFFLRPPGIWIVVDRMTSDVAHQYEQNYEIYTPVRATDWYNRTKTPIPNADNRVVLVPQATAIKTDNPGFGNVSIYQAATSPIELRFRQGSRIDNNDLDQKTPGEIRVAQSEWQRHPMGTDDAKGDASSPCKVFAFSRKVQSLFGGRGVQILVSVIVPRKADTGPEGDLRDLRSLNGSDGVVGLQATAPDGTTFAFQIGPHKENRLNMGSVGMIGESLLITTSDGTSSGIAVGCRAFTVGEKKQAVETPDFEFCLKQQGDKGPDKTSGSDDALAQRIPIYPPIAPVTFEPAHDVFTDAVQVRMESQTPGVEIHYTLNGEDPTPHSPTVASPVTLRETARIKAVAIRPGLAEIPWVIDGGRASLPTWAAYRRQESRPAVPALNAQPGLNYEYFEGTAFELFTVSNLKSPLKKGSVEKLFDVSMRTTDEEFGVRYSGWINIPTSGIYTFHAPHEFWYPDIECSYDLRLFIDGEEWYPSTRRHAFGTWSVALDRGPHAFECIFVDVRRKDGKVEAWRDFPNPKAEWKGTTPVLEVTGPGLSKRPLPDAWFTHAPQEPLNDVRNTDPAFLEARRAASEAAREAEKQKFEPRLREALLALWDFEGVEGEVIADASGSGYDGTLLGGVFVDSPRGRALRLSDRNQGFSIQGHLPIFDTEHDFTIACRIKIEPGSPGFILRKAKHWARDGLGWSAAGRVQYFNALGGNTDVSGRQEGLTGEWQWLVVTYRASSGLLRFYRNGEVTAYGTVQSPPAANDVPLHIGYDIKADIEEVRIYGRALDRETLRYLSNHSP